MTLQHRIRHLCIATFLFSTFGLCDQRALDALLTLQRSPSIADVAIALKGSNAQGSPHFTVSLKDLAETIVRFEMLAPNGKYLMLGRDAERVGHILEAFYLSVNSPDRVGYIAASTPTVQSATPRQLVQILESAGLDFKQLRDRAFVIVDRTSMGPGSQSTQFYKAAYNHALSKGIAEKWTSRHLFVVTSQDDTDPKTALRYLRDVGMAENAIGVPWLAQWTDGPVWHSGYGAPTVINGQLVGQPGAPQQHKDVLQEQISIWRQVQNPELLRLVQQLATDYGVELGFLSEEAREELARKRLEYERERRRELVARAHTARRDLAKLIASMKPIKAEKVYLSENAQQLLEWFNSMLEVPGRNRYVVDFLNGMVTAHSKGLIRNRDLRRLLARALPQINFDHPNALLEIEKVLQSQPGLATVLKSREGVFLKSKQPDAEEVATAYQTILKHKGCKALIKSAADEPKPEGKEEDEAA